MGEYEGINIWLKNHKDISLENSEWIIGHSLGASYILSKNILPHQKIILVNPLVKKRNFLSLVFRDLQFFIYEGITYNNLISVSNWFYASKQVFRLLKVYVLYNLKKLPRENIFIIRGIKDTYFYDDENVDLIKKEGFVLFEVDAYHNANKNVLEKIKEIIINN